MVRQKSVILRPFHVVKRKFASLAAKRRLVNTDKKSRSSA